MHALKHIAFYCRGNTDVNWLVKEIMHGQQFDCSATLQSMCGGLFTASALQYFIDEEINHDRLFIETPFNNRLSQSSNGEQRMALLRHVISKKPGYIIASNIFDSLDAAAQKDIFETIISVSEASLILQIINRKSDCLSIIQEVYTVADSQIVSKQSAASFREQEHLPSGQPFAQPIPLPENACQVQHAVLISMQQLSVQFGERRILHAINWQVCAGEFWQLTGPNGAGKTSLLALITGDSTKGYGQQLFLFGRKKGSGESVWDIKAQMGYFSSYMMQQFNGRHTAEQMIVGGFFDSVGLYNIPSLRQLQIAHEWLHLLGLYDKRQTVFCTITPVQQRLVLLARAMIKHPPLLILDEPTAGLDDEGAALFTALINKLAAETSTAIIYVSHRQEAGLLPQHIFELRPSPEGSTGHQVK
jgi:molybdate transport system ATP-binding protein